jgi:AtzE family amidohydrolase
MTTAPDIAASASAVRSGDVSARERVEAALARIASADSTINSFTAVTAQRARAEADAIDAIRRRGEPLPPLAGITYSVKNLFDVAGLTTLAGARLNAANPPALHDATLVRRLRAAGAMLVGAVNMDAYAYGFTTENTHYGTTRNPRDIARVAGGSSGGSAAAVAAGFCDVSLCSDTNGSIRVPSSFCGTFGLKPTFSRLSRHGSIPFVPSLDHLGPIARSARELALVYDVLQGPDQADPACAQRAIQPTLPTLEQGTKGLRIAMLGGYFAQWADADACAAVARAAAALGAGDVVEMHETDRARAAAFVITAAEAGARYLDDLRMRPEDFEPLSRERLTAGAMLPAAWLVQAQRFRRWFAEETAKLFQDYDLLLAPATPCIATTVGSTTMQINGITLPTRPSIGLLTQPISFIGLPVAVAPLWTPGSLPLGVQIIAAPWREDLCLRAAHALEQAGIASSPITKVNGDV